MHTKYTIHKFFTISNLIEGIDDNDDILRQVEIFSDLEDYVTTEWYMYYFHSIMKHLNSYCKPGELRTYDVFVGGRKCMSPELIKDALDRLFDETPKTYKEIKDWHVRFERIHPFWDGNGRTGRFIMLRQMIQNNVPIPQMFVSIKNFEENRKRYYRWF